MTQAIEDAKHDILETVEPTEHETRQLTETVHNLTERANDAIRELPVSVEVLHVGSTARRTWLRDERDIDLFLLFDPSIPRDQLESYGLEIGHAVLPAGHEEYAEHPYVRGTFHGFDVDIVPCYAVDSADVVKSSVDRTPFHNEYIKNTLTPTLQSEIRITKQFLIGIGVYGSNLRTRGFSGYLTELLIIAYDSFDQFLTTAADWRPPVRLDPAGHGTKNFDDPLVMIDPTDPSRNVAAVLTERNTARLQHFARDFLDNPRTELFFPTTPEPLDSTTFKAHLADRETTCLAITFDTPDIVEDELYPQLEKSRLGIQDSFTRTGFNVIRSAVFANERSVLWFELDRETLPAIERHTGPPVAAREHAERFYSEYESKDVYGPFIDNDRYVVERERTITTARTLCSLDKLDKVRLGPAISRAIQDQYEVLIGKETADLLDEFGQELSDYFDPTP